MALIEKLVGKKNLPADLYENAPMGYLSALPAWRLLDPRPVLARAGDEEEDEEDEALGAVAPRRPDPLRGFA